MPKPKLVLTEDEGMELLALLISSARIQMHEQARYGPLRLLTAAERLSAFMLDRASPEGKTLLEITTGEIPDMHMNMADEEWYIGKLDDLCRAVAGHIVERNGLKGGKS